MLIGDYKKSQEYAETIRCEINYNAGLDFYNSGRYDEAYEAFSLLDDYKESESYAEKSFNQVCKQKYENAELLFDNGDLMGARDIFIQLDDYSDSRKRAEECSDEVNYQTATGLLLLGDTESAADILYSISGYKYSQVILDCIYNGIPCSIENGRPVIKYGSFPQTVTILENGEELANDELIEWYVISSEGSSVRLLSKKIIYDCWYGSDTTSAGLWHDSIVRDFLNETFIDYAFTEDEIARLQYIAGETSYGAYSDRVVLLSSDEYYRLPDEVVKTELTDYVKWHDRIEGAPLWWLGNTEWPLVFHNVLAAHITRPSEVYFSATERVGVSTFAGVRPVIDLNLSGVVFYNDFVDEVSKGVKYLHIPSNHNGINILAIGMEAAMNNRDIQTVIIDEGLLWIQDNAFSGCTNLKKVSIPESIEWISPTAFEGCTKLAYYEEKSGCYLGNEINPCVVFVGPIDKDVQELVIDDRTKIILGGAGRGCKELKKLTIPESVQYIGSYAFADCPNLSSVTCLSVPVFEVGTFDKCKTISNFLTEYENGMYFSTADNPYHTLIRVMDTSREVFKCNANTQAIAEDLFSNYYVKELIMPFLEGKNVRELDELFLVWGIEAYKESAEIPDIIVYTYDGDERKASDFTLKASSTLVENVSHDVSLLYDGDLSTCWCEGVQGAGQNESLTWEFDYPISYIGAEVFPGYLKSEKTYTQNAAPKEILINIYDEYGNHLTMEADETISDVVFISDTSFEEAKKGYSSHFANLTPSEDTFRHAYLNICYRNVSKIVAYVGTYIRDGSKYDDNCISEFYIYTID